MNQNLLKVFLGAYPFQPATALWRAVEIDEVLKCGLPEGRGLDLGCGDGKLTRIILEQTGPRRLIGVDPDPLETEQAAATGIYEAVHTAFGHEIPETDQSFDFVLSNSVLEHIPNLEAILGEVARLLRVGGAFIFTVPGPGFHNCLNGPILPGLSREDYLSKLDRRLAHLRYPGADDWRDMLADRGLVLDRTSYYLDRSEVVRWETLSRFTGGLLYSLFGGKSAPIEIQRRMKFRSIQSRHGLPDPLPALFAQGVAVGLNGSGRTLTEESAGCLLLVGHKK